MRILMVSTSNDQLGDTGLKTGFWLEEGAEFRVVDHYSAGSLGFPLGGEGGLDPN